MIDESSGLIDLHCHLLPALDDGPADLKQAVELARALEQLGFSEIYPTPHQKQDAWAPDQDQRAAARAALTRALEQEGCSLVVHPAAGENMWDGLFLDRQPTRDFPHYPGNNAFLVEFPDPIPPQVLDQLFRYRLDGLLPVVAHVERYPSLLSQRPLLARMGQSAALLVNLSTLGGALGFWSQRAARQLVKQGLVHALSTDSHGMADLAHSRSGLAWLHKTVGRAGVASLLCDHPRRIVAGELPET